MTTPDRAAPHRLYGGPYAPPPCEVGSSLRCDLAGGLVTVAGVTDAPIPWPYRLARGGVRSLILCGGLADAVRAETAEAVAHHWGVSRYWVYDARRALGVGRTTAGTRRRRAELVDRALPPAARAVGSHRGGRAAAGRLRDDGPPPIHLAPDGLGVNAGLVPARPRDREALRALGWDGPAVGLDELARVVRRARRAGRWVVIRPAAPDR